MRRLLPAILLLFVISGCAALIYEVVWFQLLQLVVGVSAVSLGVLLATYMGGMCLGSVGFSRLISRRHHPLMVYAGIEFAIGVIGLLVLAVVPLVGGVYASWAAEGTASVLLRAAAAAACLLPPTVLMGATLPAIARWVEATPEGVSWLGLLYGGNIGGAVIGSLLAGFYLLRVHDTTVATGVAVTLNAAAGLGALLLARRVSAPADEHTVGASNATSLDPVYIVTALSGLTALGAEVVWTRLLALWLGATVYSFSLILGAFLIGLGLGAVGAAWLERRIARPRVALGWCQFGLAAAIAWTAYVLTSFSAPWPVDPSTSANPAEIFATDLIRCLWAVMPAVVCWGASFPLALAAVSTDRESDPARMVGGLYAANTLGAIAGALVTSLVLITRVGSHRIEQLLIGGAVLAALIALLPPERRPGDAASGRRGLGLVAAAAATIVAIGFAWMVPQTPGRLIAFGRYARTSSRSAEVIYVGEGLSASVAITQLPGGVLNYHNAGKVQASSEIEDMRLQRMLGHLTTLVPDHPRSVLVIGCGAGVTAGAVSIDPAVEHVTIAEIEPLAPYIASTYFKPYNDGVIENPKVTVRLDDARHFLQTTKTMFDAVTSDPLDPWVKGAAMLYTQEFFELVRRRLNPGGVVTVFVQLYWSNAEAVKSELATFFKVFPNGTVWGNTNNGAGYDLVLLGQVEPTTIDVDAVDARLATSAYAGVATSLQQVGFRSAVDLFSTYAGRGRDLAGWLEHADINRDRNLRLGYLAGLSLEFDRAGEIYAAMLSHAGGPEGVLTVSEDRRQALDAGIRQARIGAQ